MIKWPTFIVVALTVIALIVLLSGGVVSVWDGRFELTVIVDSAEPVEADSLWIATCWDRESADYAMLSPLADGEVSFQHPRSIEDNRFTIEAPCSGRTGSFHRELSYHQPHFLVIEYGAATDAGQPLRKLVEIPPRGKPRLVRTTLQ